MLGRFARRRSMYRGATILAQGASADVVGFVVAGVLRLVKTVPDGRQQVVDLVYPGEFFGRTHEDIADCGIEAATEAEICVVGRHEFEATIDSCHELEEALLDYAFHKLATARARSLILGCLTTAERIASFLLLAAKRRERVLSGISNAVAKHVAAIQISRHDVAAYLSTSIETISRTLQMLSRDGIIRLLGRDHFEIVDEAKLLQLSGLSTEDLEIFIPAPPTRTALPARLEGNARSHRPV